MPEWWPKLLLFVFVSHAPLFAWRYRQTREARFAATTLTFLLLALAYALRVFAPELMLGGSPLHLYARVIAWLSAALSIGLLLGHLLRRLRDLRRAASGDTARAAPEEGAVAERQAAGVATDRQT